MPASKGENGYQMGKDSEKNRRLDRSSRNLVVGQENEKDGQGMEEIALDDQMEILRRSPHGDFQGYEDSRAYGIDMGPRGEAEGFGADRVAEGRDHLDASEGSFAKTGSKKYRGISASRSSSGSASNGSFEFGDNSLYSDVDRFLKGKGFDPKSVDEAAMRAADDLLDEDPDSSSQIFSDKRDKFPSIEVSDVDASWFHDREQAIEKRLENLEKVLKKGSYLEETSYSEHSAASHEMPNIRSVLKAFDDEPYSPSGKSHDTRISRSPQVSEMELGECEAASKTSISTPDMKREAENIWTQLNRQLENCGFSSLPLDSEGKPTTRVNDDFTTMSLFNVIQDVLRQYNERGSTIDSLISETAKDQYEEKRVESLMSSAKKQLKTAEKKRKDAEDKVTRLSNKTSEAQKSYSNDMDRFRRENAALRQKLTLSEHRVRAKEAVLEKLQKQLESCVRKNESIAEKNRAAFEESVGRKPRPMISSDKHMMDVIQGFNKEKERMQGEQDWLKAEIRRLNEALLEKENLLSQNERTGLDIVGRNTNVNNSSGTKDQAKKEIVWGDSEPSVLSKIGKLEDLLRKETTEKALLEEEIQNMKLELVARPTVHAWKESHIRIANLEEKVKTLGIELEKHELEEYRRNGVYVPPSKEARDTAELSAREKVDVLTQRALNENLDNRKHTSTAELIRRDKLTRRLGLSNITSLPRAAAHEIIQNVCRVLEISDPLLLLPTVQKMAWCIQAMPPLEQLCKEVSEFVAMHGDSLTQEHLKSKPFGDKKQPGDISFVMPQLQRWVPDIKKLKASETFEDHIREAFSRSKFFRDHNSLNERVPEVDGDYLDPFEMTQGQLLSQLEHLIEIEGHFLASSDAYLSAGEYAKKHPEVVVNRFATHFCELFEIKRMEGLVPKINELYVHTNEMKNFLQILRPMLNLASNASLHACLTRIQDICRQDSYKDEKDELATGIRGDRLAEVPQWS